MMYTVLCITNRDHPHIEEFLEHHKQLSKKIGAEFLVVYDRCKPIKSKSDRHIEVCGQNVVEDILKYCFDQCNTEYILRLDDDEVLDELATNWIMTSTDLIRRFDVIAFKRLNLWKDSRTFLPELYPDLQSRLIKHGMETRSNIHEGLARDITAKGHIHHYNFLMNSKTKRGIKSEHYKKLMDTEKFIEYDKFVLPENHLKMETKEIKFKIPNVCINNNIQEWER